MDQRDAYGFHYGTYNGTHPDDGDRSYMFNLERQIRAEHRQVPRSDGTWGCLCGWVQDRPHERHVESLIHEALEL